MANITKVLSGAGYFFISYFAVILMYYIIPPIIEAGQSIYTGNEDIEGIIWLLTIILWVIMCIVIPSALTVIGLIEKSTENKFQNIIFGILIMIVSLMLTYFAWDWITIFGSILDDTLVLAIYWIGTIIMWVEITWIVPIYLIVTGYQD